MPQPDVKKAMLGRVARCSSPIDNVEPGMSFRFDDETLTIFKHEPPRSEQLIRTLLSQLGDRGQPVDSLVSCEVSATGERVVFHVTGRPGYRGGSVLLGVRDYWMLRRGVKSEDVTLVAYSGPCVDSFCPLRGEALKFGDSGGALGIPGLEETRLNGGQSEVAGRSLSVDTAVGWRMDWLRSITIEATLRIFTEGVDYEFLHTLYIGVSRALRFFLGRVNASLACSLFADEGDGYGKVGEFIVCHGRLYVPDEYDGRRERFVRAEDVGERLASVIQACSAGAINYPAFAMTREDANIITYAKVIELTAQFEKSFKRAFPQGVNHSERTKRAQNQARDALNRARETEGMNADARRILSHLADHVLEDNLQARISASLKGLPESVAAVVKREINAVADRGEVGERIASVRNSIAHGLEFKHDLGDIREEYLLLTRLVFAFRLKEFGFDEKGVARLLECVP